METALIDDYVRKQYNEDFDSKYYLREFYKKVFPDEKFTLNQLYRAFNEGRLEGPLKRCIDIGCGPVVHRMSAPSKTCDTVVYSDFSEKNRELVNNWLHQPVPDVRHHHLFHYCAEKEGYEDLEKGAIEIETRVKAKVSEVVQINVLQSPPIAELNEPFDVAFSGACLESACDSYRNYVKAVKNIATILRPGGYLLLKGYTNGNYYVVNDTRFPNLNQNVDMVKEGLTEAGFKILDMQELEEEYRHTVNSYEENKGEEKCGNCNSCFFAVAQKL